MKTLDKTAEQRLIDQIASEDAFANHTIEQRLDHGLYRNWKCSNDGSSIYMFNVSTEPGRIMVSGDLGVLVVERCEDMLQWAPNAIQSLSYFAEKVPHEIVTREYDPDVALESLESIREELMSDEEVDSVALEKLDDLRLYAHDEFVFKQELYDSGLVDGGDWPELENWKPHFLWQVEALKWFFRQLGLMKTPKEGGREAKC